MHSTAKSNIQHSAACLRACICGVTCDFLHTILPKIVLTQVRNCSTSFECHITNPVSQQMSLCCKHYARRYNAVNQLLQLLHMCTISVQHLYSVCSILAELVCTIV